MRGLSTRTTVQPNGLDIDEPNNRGIILNFVGSFIGCDQSLETTAITSAAFDTQSSGAKFPNSQSI
jgi:hypothetical protein